MWFYLLAAGLLLHTYFWGAGLACLAVPRVWRRWWWVFAPGFGLALQSAVVWLAAHTSLPGTNSYAGLAELLPLLLMGLVWRRTEKFRRAVNALSGAAGLVVLVVAAGWFQLSPMAAASRSSTTLSLGSCDAADYAAGARVMQEFSRDDRTGFLGLPEVTRVRSADYFFDFWLRLNHFTPSAFIAYGGVILDVPVHELTSVTGVVFALLNIPLLLFLARLVLGLRGGPLLGLTALLAFSPLQIYAVYHAALGQLLATQGIMLLTVGVVGAVRLRQPWLMSGPVFAGFCILAGGYNLILPVCLVPAGSWLLVQAVPRKDWRGVGRVCLVLAAALLACAVLFWPRFAGLIERFSLFEQYSFGWPIPRLTPEGWLGLVSDAQLNPRPPLIRAGLLILVLAGWLTGVIHLWARHRARALAALMFVLPLAAGWAILDHEALVRANASYDAYKLLAVFQGVLLVGLGSWCRLMQDHRSGVKYAARCLFVAALLGILAVGAEFRRAMEDAPLRVDRSLLDLVHLEMDPRITSLNIRVENFWARMWANAFLLRKPQYFVTHSYEGRLDTPLRGEWDLSDSLVRIVPASRADGIVVNGQFHLVRAGGALSVRLADGWHGSERAGRYFWRWTSGDARVLVTNSTKTVVRVRFVLRASAVEPQLLQVRLNDHDQGSRPIEAAVEVLDFGEMVLPPGDSVLELHPIKVAYFSDGRDRRRLGIAVYEAELQEFAQDR